MAEGRATPIGDGLLAVRIKLPAGYHEVVFAGMDEAHTTGLWCRPAGEVPADGFMSIDTAMSWLTKPEQRPALVKNLTRFLGAGEAGGMARERFKWAEVHPAAGGAGGAGAFDWETARRYESTRRLYAEAGVPVLEMFHDSPGWLGRAVPKAGFPENLPASDRSWRGIASRWNKYWGALEMWNEPDISFGGFFPADQYAPLVKTLRHAVRKAGAATPLGGGVFATQDASYIRLAAHNGLFDESDFISFHYYGVPSGIERLVSVHRELLAEHGRRHETKPLWLTEVGTPTDGPVAERTSQRGQLLAAPGYAKQAIEARACGVARFFAFVYEPLEERGGSIHFGMTRQNGSPLRVLAAVAQAGRALAGMEYAGDIPATRVPGAKQIRVFAPSASAASAAAPGNDDLLVILYTDPSPPLPPAAASSAAVSAAAAAAAEIKLPFRAISAQGADGRPLSLKSGADNKTVSASDGIVYLRATRTALAGILDKNTPAMRLWRLGRGAATPPPALPPVSSIVLQPQLDFDAVQPAPRGYFLPDNCEQLPVRIVVNNLGDKTRVVTLRAKGAQTPDARLTIAANARETATLTIKISGLAEDKATGDRLLLVNAVADDGSRVAPAALSFIPSLGKDNLAAHLRRQGYKYALTLNEEYRWDRNAVTGCAITFTRKPPAAWGFVAKFRPGTGDRWAYPRFTIPQEVNLSRVTGVLIRARCLKPAAVRLNIWNQRGEWHATHNPVMPADGQWHVAHVPLASVTGGATADAGGDRLAKVSLGFSSDSDENTLEISDFYLVGN
ncbi:MAG: glycosyl hydrolase [Opitutaceae bacterium]|nr:glycosyl hydrolase [Opitutaceae bacterium]